MQNLSDAWDDLSGGVQNGKIQTMMTTSPKNFLKLQ